MPSISQPALVYAFKEQEQEQENENLRKKCKGGGAHSQSGDVMGILALLTHIVNKPAPRLTPEGRFPREAVDFVDSCLMRDPEQRQSPKDLLVRFLPTLLTCSEQDSRCTDTSVDEVLAVVGD